MSEPYLPPRMACYWCKREKKMVPATIRIFSGIYAGEGFPACNEHQSIAETRALEIFTDSTKLAKDYTVSAYEVVLDDGHYRLGRLLWEAKPKAS